MASEVKSVISGLLISNPLRTNVKQLWRDYQEMEGRPVPLRELGFANFEQYLRSIPETCSVYGTGQLAEVEGIVSSKSRHINEMVLRQKKNPRRRIPARTSSQSYQQKNIQYTKNGTKPNFSQATESSKKVSPFKTSRNIVKKPQPLPNSNQIQPPIRPRPILKQVPIYEPISQEPKPQPSFQIPPNRPTPPKEVQTFFDMFARVEQPAPLSIPQISPKPDNFEKWSQCVSPVPLSIPQISPKPDNFQNGSQSVSPVAPKLQTPPKWNRSSESSRDLYPVRRQTGPRSTRLFSNTKSQTKRESKTAPRRRFPLRSSSDDSESPPVMELSLAEVAPPYRKSDILKEHSPSSVKIRSLPQQLPKYSKEFEEFEENCDIPMVIQKNLKQLIQQFPDGLESSLLPKEYKKMFNKTISYLDYDYRSVIHMCSDLPKIFKYVQARDDYVLFDEKQPISDSVLKRLTDQPEPVIVENVVKSEYAEELAQINMITTQLFVPPDVCQMDTEISRLTLIDISVNDVIDVTMGEICDLSKFWMYLTYGGLDAMMKEMQSFFSMNHSSYHVPENLIEEGLYCVGYYYGKYHRCVIVGTRRPLDFVRILYIDYGTVDMVPANEIWFLPKKFSNIPWQALRGRLANLCPPTEKHPWTEAAILRFAKLVAAKVLVAKIVKINSKENSLDVNLADITDPDNIFFVNDILTQEGFAITTDQERKPTPLDPDCVPIISRIHRYPSFYEIESGSAPTREEMKYIFQKKMPLHIVMPQYFDIYYKEDIASIEREYRENHKKRSQIVAALTAEEPEIDFSYFPDDLAKEMRAEHEAMEIKLRAEKAIKRGAIDPNESVKEYSCNKKRISKIKAGIVSDSNEDGLRGSKDSYDSSFSNYGFSPEPCTDLVPLIRSLDELNFNNNNSYDCPNTSQTLPPTSMYCNGNRSTVPLLPTNPFLTDIYNSESTSDSPPQKSNDNLKSTNPWPLYKPVRQFSANETVREASRNAETSSTSSFSTESTLTAAEMNGITPAIASVPRIRAPPGFNQINPQNLRPIHVQPAVTNFINFVSSANPYYQRTSVNGNGGVELAPQMFLPLLQSQCNTVIPPPFPFPVSYGYNNFQQFCRAQNFQPPYQ